MNNEVFKIRQNNEIEDESYGKAIKLTDQELIDYQYVLNSNMTKIYNAKNNPHTSVDAYIDCFTHNLYLVLEIFAKMNVYPDYFFDVVFKRNIDLKKVASESSVTNFKNSDVLSGTVGSKIKQGIENGYNHINSGEQKEFVLKRDINDYFTEMVSFYQVFGMEYGNCNLNQCRKSFNKHYINIINIMGDLTISDYVYSDVESLTQLLFEYLSFFVEIGVNPKDYLDELIKEKENKKTK